MPPDLTPNPNDYPQLRISLERWWMNRTIFRSSPGWGMRLAILFVLLLFVIVVLPYLLPLGGLQIVDPMLLMDANGAFVKLAGEDIYYIHEAGNGPTVLLIHGLGGSTVSWQDTIPALAAAGYDVYAVDLAGFGLSSKGLDRDYSHHAQAVRVIALMDTLHIEKATIVGHSMGGNVAAYLALAYPERVDRLVLVDAAILTSNGLAVPDFLIDLPFIQRWGQFGLRRIFASRAGDLIRDAAYDDAAISQDLINAYSRVFRTPDWDTGLLGIARDGDQNVLPSSVSNIQAITLILWGAEDTWVPPGDALRLEELIPNAQCVEIAGAGHLPMHEKPDQFNTALVDFLDAE
ncbi:MAG TPA: alpha/beta hydrolase [Aggregatilineaceae bacterium]|nr:alpha/beta hydrolase [Aggregatilineaceae bacterium]